MPTKFPAPNYNRLIEQDPQIVKVAMDEFGWGARPAHFAEFQNPRSLQSTIQTGRKNVPAAPDAPEMTVQHTKD